MLPDFLAIGHIAKDVSPDGYRLGGTAAFGALTALRLGLRPGIVTSFAPGLDAGHAALDVPLHTVPSAATTTFHNTYPEGARVQRLRGVASPITPSDVPREWRSVPMVLLGPIAGEVSFDLARWFPRSLVVASLQGWLRRWGPDGRVAPRYWYGREVLPCVDAAVVSIEDVEDRGLIAAWAEIAPLLIVTRGAGGASVHARGVWHEIEAYPALEVDPTGAGDVFAAAYLVGLHETEKPLDAARFASCVASFCVEADGVSGIPTRAQVEERL